MLTFGKAKDNEMEEISDKKLRIGVSFNGRQFPGAHNIIQGLMNDNTEVIGFLNGTKGLFKQ